MTSRPAHLLRVAARRPALALALAAMLAPTLATAQTVNVLRAEAGGTYELWNAAESGGSAVPVAGGLSFLPLQLDGVAVGERLRTDRPVPVAGAPALHVRLPQGGTLWRVQASGATSLLHVGADGGPALLATRADVGGVPALAAGVAVSRDGSRALVASTAAAGGELVLIDLATRDELVVGAGLDVDPISLRVSAQRAFFVAGGALHASLLSAGPPVGATPPAVVDLGLPGTDALGELALSADGRTVVVVSQDALGGRRISVVDASLGAQLLTPQPGDYDTPGYDLPLGPRLVVSDDGSRVAWRGTVLATELFVRIVPQPAPPVQVTADVQFVDTIDSVGVLGFHGGRLTFLAGETGVAQIGKADVYSAGVDAAGVLDVTNETLTSGAALPPFQPGALEVTAITQAPTGSALLLEVDPDGGDAALYAADTSGPTGVTPLLPALRSAPTLVPAGERVLVVSAPEPGTSTQLHLVGAGGGGLQLLATVPAGLALGRFAAARDGSEAAFVASVAPGIELPVRVTLGTGGLALMWPAWAGVAPALAYSPTGRLVLGLGGGGGPYLWASLTGPSAGALLGLPVGAGLPLDG